MEEHIKLLGLKGKDKVTGRKGVITSIGYDLYGCIQVVLVGEDGEGKWYDLSRINVSNKRVMPYPDFANNETLRQGKKGPENKPIL